MNEPFYRLPANLAEDISDHARDVGRFVSGQVPEGVFRAKRVPRGVYEQRTDSTYMVRVRIAGGAVTSTQARVLAEAARDCGNGRLHMTTRQDIQIHEVSIENTPEVMRRLMPVGLTSKGGGGNTVRNITACPYAGVCPYEMFDVTQFAHLVTEYLIPLVGSYNLPRKYKIAFSGCSADCAVARANDLGFVACIKDGEPGFTVYAGGGMGAHSRMGDVLEEWISGKDVVRAAEAVRRLFDRLGNRKDRHRARLRFVFEKIGVEEFRKQFRREMAAKKKDDVPACSPSVLVRTNVPTAPVTGYQVRERDGVRIVRQHQDGLVSVPVHLPLGFVSWQDFREIGTIANRFSLEDGIRTVRSQDLVLRSVRQGDLQDLSDALKELSIDVLSPSHLERFVACAGASTCRLGLCLSREAAKACSEAFAETNIDHEALRSFNINISGCPNACGHHPVASIGLFGAAQRSEGRLVPAYRVVLGARHLNAEARLAQAVGTVPARALPKFLVHLAQDFLRGRTEGETFVQYFDRRGVEHFQQLAEGHRNIPPYAESPDFYRDWGQDGDFSLAGRGAGECGAGVFEVVREDITAARKALELIENEPARAFDALLAAIRSLLITRGVDSQDPGEIVRAFETHFVDSGLVGAEFRGLLSRARGHVEGWKEALDGSHGEIQRLLERVELLFSSMDANLKFHLPEESEAKSPCTGEAPSAGDIPTPAQSIDLRGVACPMNFVKAKLKLETMETGAMLKIVLDAGEPVQNVPASFRNEGQEVVETTSLADGHWQVVVQKKK